MPLFQKNIIKKYIHQQEKNLIDEKWNLFKNHFLDPTIQENIRNSKEEQYQEGFFRDLFVKILGYTLNPAPNFNLTTEYKNIKDSKKADGAIIIGGKVLGVIELKGTNTTDLSKIEAQAFGYKNNQPDCVYVVSSNFEKLRFYIDNATEFIEFSLFHLSYDEFQLLYLCLSFENISQNLPKKIKNESISQEENITKKLYNDYSNFKNELFRNLCQQNPTIEKLTLFKKSQKLLDRFLFLFFAEDCYLLPANSVRKILDDWQKLKELDAYLPLYQRFKQYFGYLNDGNKERDIFAYNGGLFAPDALLDTIKIDDEILYRNTKKLSEYDFSSEVDVNILGHIFENSLGEIDEIQANINGENIEKSETKRKKDGVFYTPKYITKYIVENTVGKLCTEKKQAFLINEADFSAKQTKKNKEILLEKLKNYRDWLLQITIIDPACGSGAFLNEALNFLIAEHQFLDELETKLLGGGFTFPNIENSILENNLFGVDINEESVEIAKLSLWLRTAQKGRKLNDLSANIKCGNSLIDDKNIAGDKAFNWEKEFPKIFVEKNKKAFHITTAIHDSRTSQRMVDYKVREFRYMGTQPEAQIVPFSEEEELIVSQTIAEIVKEKKLNVLAYNICIDHLHLLLVCEEEEVSKIMQVIKGRTALYVNKHRNKEIQGAKATLSGETENTTHPARDFSPLSKEIQGAKATLSKEIQGAKATLSEKTKNKPIWTQKFGCVEIADEGQLFNTINYIETNRTKHEIEDTPTFSKALSQIISGMLCSYEMAFTTEYKGGFDVVIGNPPYGAKIDKNQLDYLCEKYKIQGLNKVFSDTYIAFYILGMEKLIKNNGLLGYIAPNTWRMVKNGQEFRQYLLTNFNIQKIIQHTEKVFFDATVDVDTIIIENNFSNENIISTIIGNIGNDFQTNTVIQNTLLSQDFINLALNNSSIKLKEKIELNSLKLSEICNVKNGIKPYEKGKGKPAQTTETLKEKPFTSENKIDDTFSPLIGGSNFHRYRILWNNDNWIKYGEWLAAPRDKAIFDAPEKLIFRQTSDSIIGCLITDGFIMRNNTHIVLQSNTEYNLKYILSVTNSKLLNFYYSMINPEKGEALAEVKAFHLEMLPIKEIPLTEQKPFIEKADLMLQLHKNWQEKKEKFLRRLLGNFAIEKVSKKLENFWELSFADFIKELKKQKIEISLKTQDEWEDYFLAYQSEMLELNAEISATDNSINQMVYQLYNLTPEEISVINT